MGGWFKLVDWVLRLLNTLTDPIALLWIGISTLFTTAAAGTLAVLRAVQAVIPDFIRFCGYIQSFAAQYNSLVQSNQYWSLFADMLAFDTFAESLTYFLALF